MKSIILFFFTLCFSFILDMIWLGWVAKNIYAEQLGFLMKKSNGVMTPNWTAAAIVYFFITLGIMSFVLPKANGSLYQACIWGALFGAVTYGIYDFTNLAVLQNWPLKITLIDLIWGTFLCGSTSLVAMLIHKLINV